MLEAVNQYCSYSLQEEEEAYITYRAKGKTCHPALNRNLKYQMHNLCKILHLAKTRRK